MWVYQHDADEKVATTHCHIVVLDSERDAEGLKKLTSWKKLQLKGNGGSSFKSYKKIYDLEHYMTWFECLKYASKGHLDPRLIHGDNAQTIADESRSHWNADADANKQTANADVITVRKTKRITQFDVARLAQSRYMEKYTEEVMGKPHLEYNAHKLGIIVSELLRENRMCAKWQIVAGIIQDIQLELNPTRYWQKVLSMV